VDQRQLWLDSIDAFLFDLGNVLVRFSHEAMMQQMAAVTGQTPARIRQLLVDDQLLVAVETGHISADEFVRRFRVDSPRPFAVPDFVRAMADIFSPIPETVGLLPRLRAAGKRLVLVSNTSSIHYEWEERSHPWLSAFDAKILSYRIGAMKPHPDFYRQALAQAGTAAERCLFVDDIADNIDGARRAGFQTHHFTDPQAFIDRFPAFPLSGG
jgi:putative hydrolase of the HAD superfamily